MKLGVSYFGNRIPRHVAADMKYLSDNHFTYVVHTFSENDYHFYHGTMKEIMAISRDNGLETFIDPWGVGKIFGGEAFSEFISSQPQVRQILNDGQPAPIACLNNPEFRSFLKKWIDAAAETGSDYVFWDEPHFYIAGWMGGRPGTWGCRCSFCRDKYQSQHGAPMPDVETATVKDFKNDSIRDLLQEMILYAHKLGLKNSLCVLPHSAEDNRALQLLAGMEHLDNYGTDPYWYAFQKDASEYVGTFAKKVVDVTAELGREHHLWIQGFKVPAGREDEIGIAVKAAADAGIRSLAVWGFDACAHMSYIAPGNPVRAWQAVLDAFKSVRDVV